MAKYLSVLLNDVVDAGTTTSASAGKLVDSTQNFLSTVKVGDFVINNDDPNTPMVTVTAVDSNTTLSLSSNIAGNADDYTIYSSTSKREQLIGIGNGALLVEYDSLFTNLYTEALAHPKKFVIGHSLVNDNSFCLAIQNALLKAENRKEEPKFVVRLELPAGVIARYANIA